MSDDHLDADGTEAQAPAPEPTGELVAKPRRSLLRPGPRTRTVLRWSVATVLCLGVGTGTAFAVMAPKRTDLPGLATPSDGRYVYPALRLPELPPGAGGPREGGASSGQPGGTVPHAADLRQLLLPAAVGGVVDHAYPGATGWVPQSAFAGLFTESAPLSEELSESGARHVAATGWRMPDGTKVTIYLVAFRSSSSAQTVFSYLNGMGPADAPGQIFPDSDPVVRLGANDVMSRPAGHGKAALRMAIFSDQDVLGALVMTNPKAVGQADFDQALTLQMELLEG